MLPEKFVLPLYTAVRDRVPAGRVELVKLATPPVSVALPRAVIPFLNVTVPVGVPEEEDTVAVKITACP